jgi:D-amino-acid dehydrogenase
LEQIVVVGGGIVGSSAAYELASHGVPVTLVDREDEGHATQAGAGIVSRVGASRRQSGWPALAAAAVAHYPRLVERLAADGVTDSGWSLTHGLIVGQPEEREALTELHAHLVAAGAREEGAIELLGPGEAERLFPDIDRRLSAIHVEREARVDGRAFRRSLRTALAHRGGRVLNGSATLVIEHGRVTGVTVGAERVAADRVLLCTGAWASELTRELLPDLRIAPQRGQIVHLAVPGQETGRWPIVTGFHSHYLLPFPDRVVVGATRETGSGFDYRFTAAGVREVLSEALRIVPGLADATLREMRIGFRPLSSDGMPVVGAVPGAEGLFLATGMGPSGLTLGPVCGAILAGLALGEPAPIDLVAFAPDRQAGRINRR